MISANNYLYLAFEHKHDIYFTDSLMVLDGDAYLWYLLRQKYRFDVILFVEQREQELFLRTIDTVSEQSLFPEPGGWFKLAKMHQPSPSRTILRREYRLRDRDIYEADFFPWLYKRMGKAGRKTFAFVITLDALERLWRSAGESGSQQLRSSIRQPDGRSALICRISPQAENLTEAFLDPDALLPRISQQVAAAVNGRREALADALDRYMGDQILKLHLPDGVENMLRCLAAAGTVPGSLQELRDQAEYFQNSINRYGYCLADDPKAPAPVTRRDVFAKLKDSNFRSTLRSRTQELRLRYPDIPLEKGMAATIPPDPPSWIPDYDDPFIRDIRSLKLPEEEKWQEPLRRILQNVQTFWNKPRNGLVCKKIALFCAALTGAVQQKDWETAWDALQILDFCSEQLCADVQQEVKLADIFKNGEMVVGLAKKVFAAAKKSWTADYGPHLTGYYANKVYQEQQILDKIADAKSQDDLMKLYHIRLALYTSMEEFSQQQICGAGIRRIYQEQIRSLQETVEKIDSQPNSQQSQYHPDQDGFDESDYLPAQQDTAALPYTPEQREKDRLAGERLLQSTDIF